jgi:hypothetical protein
LGNPIKNTTEKMSAMIQARACLTFQLSCDTRFCFLGDGESGAPGVMAKPCRSAGDGESLRQAFAISVLK